MKMRLKNSQVEAVEGLHTEYPYVLHHVDLGETKVPWHWHEELEFDYVVSGTLRVATMNKTYIFHKNEACFINTNLLCMMEKVEEQEPCVIDSHLFHPVFLGGHFRSIYETKYLEPVLQNKNIGIVGLYGKSRMQKDMLKKLKQAAFLQSLENTEFQTRNLFSEIWLLLLEELQNPAYETIAPKPVSQERIQSMMSFIHENYARKLSLQDIAGAAKVSDRECLRCFRESIRRTPFEYLLDYRIEAAEKLLKTTDLPITDIALQTGFSTPAYFGKVFKKVSGKTPGAYRKALHQSTRPGIG